jgi:catechol 2,3-dioxygenase-like lactoylglutathione lyase family enzyme
MPRSDGLAPEAAGRDWKVENTIPVLAVSDLPASIRFYRDLLGFQLDWGGQDETSQIASVSRDGHAIMLQLREPVVPGWVWIGLSDLAALWGRIRSTPEVIVVRRPTNQSWALEMRIQDPSGNILWFGAEPLQNVPPGTEPADCQLPTAS